MSNDDHSGENNAENGPNNTPNNTPNNAQHNEPQTGLSAIIKKPALGVNQRGAGAGVTGLLGFLGLLFIAMLFFITENYFVSMATISFGLMVYVAGIDTGKILMSSFTISFSNKHLIPKAACLVETMDELNRILSLTKSRSGEIKIGPVPKEATITLPDNLLSRDIQKLVEENKDYDYAEYVAHSYYNECHELYDYSVSNLEFVAESMPLFGLIGTILGLIAMFDGLGANVSIESLTPQLALALKTTLYGAIFSSIYKIISSRFEQRLKALEYDYETVCHALEVVIENKNKVEVKS